MSIRAVFFDYGGVIQRTEFQEPRLQLAKRFGLSYDDLDNLVFSSESAKRATLGEISVEQHWAEIARHLKLDEKEIIAVEAQFFNGDIVDESILDYLRSLRPRFYVGLISNAWSDMRDYLTRNGVAFAFDYLTISAEIGAAKPDAAIYQFALEQAQVAPNEALFVDDMAANIEACERLGMRGIHFRNPQAAMERVKEILKA